MRLCFAKHMQTISVTMDTCSITWHVKTSLHCKVTILFFGGMVAKYLQYMNMYICASHCMCLYNLFRPYDLFFFSPQICFCVTQQIVFFIQNHTIAQWFTKKELVGTARSLITHSKYLDSSPIWNQLLQVISVKHPLPLAWIQLHFCEISLTICSAISLDFFKLCLEVFNRGSISMYPVFRWTGFTETEPLSGC